jgi:hypothetical protein
LTKKRNKAIMHEMLLQTRISLPPWKVKSKKGTGIETQQNRNMEFLILCSVPFPLRVEDAVGIKQWERSLGL